MVNTDIDYILKNDRSAFFHSLSLTLSLSLSHTHTHTHKSLGLSFTVMIRVTFYACVVQDIHVLITHRLTLTEFNVIFLVTDFLLMTLYKIRVYTCGVMFVVVVAASKTCSLICLLLLTTAMD